MSVLFLTSLIIRSRNTFKHSPKKRKPTDYFISFMKGKLLPLIPFFNVANFRITKGSSKNWGEMFEQPTRKKKAVREYFTEQLF